MATEKFKYFTGSTLEVVAGISELWLAMKDRIGIQHWLVCITYGAQNKRNILILRHSRRLPNAMTYRLRLMEAVTDAFSRNTISHVRRP